MSEDRTIELLYERASGCLARGDVDGAIELLERILAIDPTLDFAHATLAMCLVDRRLVHAARAEAELAMRLDPESALSRHALALVLLAEGKRRAAMAELDRAIELDPIDADLRVQLAKVQRSLGLDGEAALREALELGPEDPDILTAWSSFEHQRGRLDEAERYAREALELDPEHDDALLAMGWVLLGRGQVEDAREHAATSIRSNPSGEDGLRLLAACRARRSPLLGLWFRFNMKVSQQSERGELAVLLGLYLAYRVLALVFEDLELPLAGQIVTWVWLAFVAYTWFAPLLFRRSLERELGELRFDPDY